MQTNLPFLCCPSFAWLSFQENFPFVCSEVELSALLQYVANQLKATESLDLLVLREILFTMTVRQLVLQDILCAHETVGCWCCGGPFGKAVLGSTQHLCCYFTVVETPL